MAEAPPIDRLLNQVPDSPEQVLQQLRDHPGLASKQDSHGYSLLHAATSYGHVELAKALMQQYQVDPNITDEDGETCLFNAESAEMAKELLALGVNMGACNDDGQTAAEKLDDEDEQPMVAAYLREAAGNPSTEAAASIVAQTGVAAYTTAAQADTVNGAGSDDVHAPPPLPADLKINMGIMDPNEAGEAPDPEFRRRIEELAAREDFQTDEGQRELRDLVHDAVSGIAPDGQGGGSRRRLG